MNPKDTNILPEDLRPQQTVGDYLTRLTVEPLLRSSALAYAVRQYCDEGYTGLELVQKVYEWNLEGIRPRRFQKKSSGVRAVLYAGAPR